MKPIRTGAGRREGLLSPISLIEVMGMVVVIFLGFAPIILQFISSMARSWFWPELVPPEWGWRAWRYAISPEAGLAAAIANSLLIAVVVGLLAVIIALPAARVLALKPLTGRRWLYFLLFLPLLAPPLASTMGMHVLFLRYGLADTLSGVILIHLVPSVPYATMVLTANMARFDVRLEAQARTLGATRFKVWRHVTLPLLRSGLAIAFGFAFLISWSQYLTTLIIGGGQVITLPLALVAFQQSGDEPVAAVLSLIFLAPAVLVLIVMGRWMLPMGAEIKDGGGSGQVS